MQLDLSHKKYPSLNILQLNMCMCHVEHCRRIVSICSVSGTFDVDFNMIVRQIFLQSPNSSHHQYYF